MLMITIFGVSCLCLGLEGAPLEYSDTRYDDVELTSVLSNDELYIKLFQCIIGRGKCTPDWEILKVIFDLMRQGYGNESTVMPDDPTPAGSDAFVFGDSPDVVPVFVPSTLKPPITSK